MDNLEINTNFARYSVKVSNDLLQQIVRSNANKNIIISPFSIQLCIGMAFNGATGETAQQMATGLSLVQNDRSAVAQSFQNVLKFYSSSSSLVKIANRIYVKNGYGIKPEFNQIATESYNSAAEEIDFEANVMAAGKINGWVEEKTNNKIKDLISPGDLDENTRMVLVNAIYFKGPWRNKFKADDTKKEDFFLNDSDSVKVDMMNAKAKFNFGYFEEFGFSALEMPYKDSNISMLVLLPNSRTGLTELVQKLNTIDLLELTDKMSFEEVIVKFPKFKVEFSMELKEPLSKMGMEKMFSNEAEFGDILTSPESLKVSKVIHKAFIEVNEEGTEAAAATGMIMMMRCALISPQFEATHPFVYLLKNNQSVLFAGTFVNKE